MGSAKLHRDVDILRRSGSRVQYSDGLVDHRNQNTVYNKAGSLVDLNRSLSDIRSDLLDLIHHLLRRILALDHLNELHTVSGIEEMHTDHRTIQPLADPCNGKRRGIGSKDTILLNNTLQLLEDTLLDLHLLKGYLDDQIAVSADIV